MSGKERQCITAYKMVLDFLLFVSPFCIVIIVIKIILETYGKISSQKYIDHMQI